MDSQTKDKPKTYTFVIEHMNDLPIKRSYNSGEECSSTSLCFGQGKFERKLVSITVLQDIDSIVNY